MGDNITSSSVKWSRRLIDFCLCIDRSNHAQAQGMFSETPVLSSDKTPLVDNILNSNAETESISALYKDMCAIAGNNVSGRTTNTLSTVSSTQSLAVNKENGKVILNDKNSSANSKERNESQTTNGPIAGRDLLTTSAQNGVRQVSSSKSPSQPVTLNGKPGVLNSTIYDSSKVNESKLKNGLKGEKYLPRVSAQNGASKLRSSKLSSHLIMLNEESNSVNGKKISNIANGGKSGSRTEKLAVNENCAQTASGQNHVNKVCRYSLKPLSCKTGSLKNINENHGQTSRDKEKVGSFIEVSSSSYIDDIIQNRVSNNGKGKMRTKSNDESQTKNYPSDKDLTAFLQNSIEKDFKYSSGSNKIGGMPNQSEQIEQILRCFEKSRAMKDDMKDENKISLDNNKLRLRRLGKKYTRSVSLQPPAAEQLPTDSVSSQQNVDKVENKEVPNSQTTSGTCHKDRIKRLSLPNLYSGCAYVIAKENEFVSFRPFYVKPLKVPIELHRVMSFPNLPRGGTAVFNELSKHISLPNFLDKEQIDNVPCTNLNIPPILPSDNLKVERERVTGGGQIKDDDSKKESLPDLISRDRSLED